MARIMHLTTPHMRGKDVTALQKALNNNKVWKQDFLTGAGVDGDFGKYTAQAVYRAKYWMGYGNCNQSAGEPIMEYLLGKKKPTSAMRIRRKVRLRRKAATPLRVKALAKMKTHLGEKENPPGSNICPITRKWKLIGAWCCMGVSEAYVQAGSKSFSRTAWKYTSCGVIAGAAEAGRDGLSVTKLPKPGDLVLMKWPGLTNYRFDHIEMVEVARPLKTIGCNTSPDSGGSQANGGMCCRKDREDERKSGIIKMYIHVSK